MISAGEGPGSLVGAAAQSPARRGRRRLATLTVVSEVSARNRVLIEIDRTLCFGFGDCVDTAPGVFVLDEEDKAVVIDPDAEDLDFILGAAQNCPVDAIIVTDEHGAQIYP